MDTRSIIRPAVKSMDAATCREWENRVSSTLEKRSKTHYGKRAKRCAKCGYFSSITQRNKHINNEQEKRKTFRHQEGTCLHRTVANCIKWLINSSKTSPLTKSRSWDTGRVVLFMAEKVAQVSSVCHKNLPAPPAAYESQQLAAFNSETFPIDVATNDKILCVIPFWNRVCTLYIETCGCSDGRLATKRPEKIWHHPASQPRELVTEHKQKLLVEQHFPLRYWGKSQRKKAFSWVYFTESSRHFALSTILTFANMFQL